VSTIISGEEYCRPGNTPGLMSRISQPMNQGEKQQLDTKLHLKMNAHAGCGHQKHNASSLLSAKEALNYSSPFLEIPLSF
jgi:hypothetical protein